MQSDQDHPQDTAEAFAKLFEKTLGYVPRAPIEGLNDGDYQPRSLPPPVPHLLGMLDAPPRLVAHLALVHDAAMGTVEGLDGQFPQLDFDRSGVLFGAATHDLGKVEHPSELTGPGSQHEATGPVILEAHGVPPQLARFARTHGAWSSQALPLEDLLVALADTVWKGQRLEDLEFLVVAQLAELTGTEPWETFSRLDGILDQIASRGEERLAWQGRRE
jgi:hypothetical protein